MRTQLPQPGGLEAELNPAWFSQGRELRRIVIVSEVPGHQPDHVNSVPPCSLNHAVCGSVKVDSIDLVSAYRQFWGQNRRTRRACLRLLLTKPYAAREMRCLLGLRLIRQNPASDQTTIRQ